MKPYTSRQKLLIVNSFKRVFSTGDIEELSASAYRFIMLASGFIAHYNLYGFRDAYREVGDLKRDILANGQSNQWSNFYPGEENYEYYQSKAAIYRELEKVAAGRETNRRELAGEVV